MSEQKEQQISIRQESTLKKNLHRATALGAAAFVVVAGSKLNILPNIDNVFKGGRSDPAPKGEVIYQGQHVKTVAARFLIKIGDGEAIVSAKAKQDWDKHGNIFNGDWQPTNGTSFVSDPKHHDLPATLRVHTEYCADGLIEKTTTTSKPSEKPSTKAVFHVGNLMICDAILEHTPENDSSFRQDDTPADFHGNFVSFMARAAEAEAKAAPCPVAELEQFTSDKFENYARGLIATQMDLSTSDVSIERGVVGHSSKQTQDELNRLVNSYANKRDPNNPNKTYEALSIQFLDGGGKAVVDSCFQDIGGVDITTLEQFNPSASLNSPNSPTIKH